MKPIPSFAPRTSRNLRVEARERQLPFMSEGAYNALRATGDGRKEVGHACDFCLSGGRGLLASCTHERPSRRLEAGQSRLEFCSSLGRQDRPARRSAACPHYHANDMRVDRREYDRVPRRQLPRCGSRTSTGGCTGLGSGSMTLVTRQYGDRRPVPRRHRARRRPGQSNPGRQLRRSATSRPIAVRPVLGLATVERVEPLAVDASR